jgi:hypothetical protein
MRWVRRHERLGGWLALFALALQLTLSFGHVHLDKGAPLSSAAALAISSSQDGGNTSPDPHRRTAGHDFCAICATIGLASTSLLPETAALVPPTAHHYRWLRDYAIGRHASEPHFSFQARGPPTAA